MKLKHYSYLLLSGLYIFSSPVLAEEVEEPEIAVEQPQQEKRHSPDESLADTLSKAYISNPQLEAQRRSFQATVEQVPQALAGALPSVNTAYSKGRQRTRAAGAGWTHADSELKSLSVSQPLFRGGTTYANTKAARRAVDAALALLKRVEQSVLLEAITAYVDVVRAQAVLDLSEKNRDVLGKQLVAATQRFEVGEDTRTDVAQSEARAALAMSDVINSKGRVESAKAVYREIVGEMPHSLKAPERLPKLPRTLDELIERALIQNPLIKQSEAQMESADYQIDANVGTLLPSVNLEGSMTRQEGVGTFGTTAFDQDEIVLSASLPLYSGGTRYSQIRQAKETYQQRRFELLDARNEVRRLAISSWEDWLAATSTIESNKAAIEAAEVALEGVRQEQQYGSRTTLDVLDAERELFNAQVELVVAERDQVVAAYTVLGVLGQLTAENLGLDVSLYDAEGYYSDTEYQFIGF